mmetsp:Transcript_4842/g.10286  ORF Transcript_4842/g.10286 Transcript_4842/m.10286 type:complete len:116 (-) Transcript_4842:22-369(-)
MLDGESRVLVERMANMVSWNTWVPDVCTGICIRKEKQVGSFSSWLLKEENETEQDIVTQASRGKTINRYTSPALHNQGLRKPNSDHGDMEINAPTSQAVSNTADLEKDMPTQYNK